MQLLKQRSEEMVQSMTQAGVDLALINTVAGKGGLIILKCFVQI